MEIRVRLPGLDDKGYFKFARESSTFFNVLRNPMMCSVDEINKAQDWLMSLVVVPDGEDEKKYKKEARKAIDESSFNDLIELISNPAQPDPK